MSYTTYQGDLAGFSINPHALVEEYEGVQGQREFYAPRYETVQQQQSRLPDLRNFLYLKPNLQLLTNKPQLLDFYTSDQAGHYLLVAQGLSSTGQLGYTSFTLDVKSPL